VPTSLEQKQDRHAEEVTGNVARTCRCYGISRPTFYKSLRKIQMYLKRYHDITITSSAIYNILVRA